MTIRSSADGGPLPHDEEQPPHEGARSVQRLATRKKIRVQWRYGDGAPSPYSGRIFATARDAIGCAVALSNAYAAIEHAKERRARLLDAARAASETEWADVDASLATDLAAVRALAAAGRMLSERAIQSFVLNHDLPGTRHALRMVAEEDTYASRAVITTPFGVEAEVELRVPEYHALRRVRRFADLVRPKRAPSAESGVHSKGAMIRGEELGALVVSAIDVGARRIVVTLREAAHAGPGYKLRFDSKSTRIHVALSRLSDDGGDSDAIIPLASEDRTPLLRAWMHLVEATRDLPMHRGAVVAMAIEGKPMREVDDPRFLSERLVNLLAPILHEIARRSGADDALVLCRDRGEARISYAELYERIEALPPELRAIFAPLETLRR